MSRRGTSPFHIRSVDADPRSGLILLNYGFADGPNFTERVELPPRPHAVGSAQFDAASKLLLLVAGTSYYKSQAPDSLVVDVPTTEAERHLVTELYDHGMREFAFTNRLPIPLVENITFSGEPLTPTPLDRPESDAIDHPLVPFGGGKDSTVVLSLLPEARPVTVNPTSTHAKVASVLRHELIPVRRVVDNLPELTHPDRLNGHIPITAIISAVSVALAVRDRFSSVVLANEAAADEPTLISNHPESDGRAVNHQWSKGATFEALFDTALGSNGVGVRYFSWLRNVPEPDIMNLLSEQRKALDVLVSCNRAFAGRTVGTATEAPQLWCGECPKCLFTFLMLATKLSPERLSGIFGSDLLSIPERRHGFAQLWADVKPLECVGERIDAAGALVAIATSEEWQGYPVVHELLPSAQGALESGEWDLLDADDEQLTPRPAPAAFVARLNHALGLVH